VGEPFLALSRKLSAPAPQGGGGEHLLASVAVAAWLGIPILDSVPWDGRNSEFRFRFPEPRTFRRKLKSENLKTVQVENRNSASDFGIPLFTYIGT
jgi:hypothetical protein